MPFRKRASKAPKPRRRRRRVAKKGTQSTKPAAVSYSSGLALLAPKYVGKMRYRSRQLMPAGLSDVPNIYLWKATSIFDPDQTGGGAQPSTHDELALFYNHYMVLGCKITIKAVLPSGSDGSTYLFLTSADNTTSTNRNTVFELMNNFDTTRRIMDKEHRTATISRTYSKKKSFGNMRDDDLTALFSADPVENKYFRIGTVNFGSGATPMPVDIEVTLDYTVLCSERKAIGTS